MKQIEENVINRKKAETLFQTMIDAARDDYKKLSPHGRKCFIQIAFAYFQEKERAIPKPPPETQTKPEVAHCNEVDEAIEQLKTIIEMCDEIPFAGEEFAESVADGCRSMIENICNFRRVTQSQWTAMDNWLSGVNRWLSS